uniref:Uncharacterized protein n=1 Tax=Ananas comosus var. bracteatus TaxID=296719 RepID=A0A6V7QY68_ANACO
MDDSAFHVAAGAFEHLSPLRFVSFTFPTHSRTPATPTAILFASPSSTRRSRAHPVLESPPCSSPSAARTTGSSPLSPATSNSSPPPPTTTTTTTPSPASSSSAASLLPLPPPLPNPTSAPYSDRIRTRLCCSKASSAPPCSLP